MDSQDKTIVRFDFQEVIVPSHPGVVSSEGIDKPLHMLPVGGKRSWSLQFDELPKLILQMTLADGTVGISEFYRDHNWSTVEGVSNLLLGQNVAELCLQDLPIGLCREYDGFECAIWDAYAKSLDVPLHRLLGGAVRSHVKISAWSSHRTIEEIGPWVRQFHEQGFDCIKFKCDLEDDVVGWCRKIKDFAPGMKVILDPNQRWENSGNARPLIRELEAVGNVLLLEDPIARWMVQDYAALRQFTSIPLVLHVSLPYVLQGQRPYEAVNAIAHGAVDGFNFNGGLAKFQALAHLATMAGMYCWHGSEVDLGILEAMYVHQAAAAASCVWPSDIFGRMIRSHDLLKTPLVIEPPYLRVPQGPGLGIELDQDAVRRFQVSERTIQ